MIRNVIDIMIGGFDNGRTPHVQQYDVESREYECRLWRAPGLPYQLAEDALVGVVYRWRRNPGSKEYETKIENRSTVVVKIPQEAMKMDGIVTMQLRLHEGGTVLNGPEIEFVVLRSIEPGDDEGDEPVPLLVALVGQTQEVLTQIRTALENGEFNGKDGTSPEVKLTRVDGGIRIDVVNEKSQYSEMVYDGKDALTPDKIVTEVNGKTGKVILNAEDVGAPVMKAVSAGDAIDKAASGRAMSMLAEIKPRTENGGFAPDTDGGEFKIGGETVLTVNGKEYRTQLPDGVCAGSMDWATGEVVSTGIVKDVSSYPIKEYGTNSTGLKYVSISSTGLSSMVMCNRYTRNDSAPYADKSVRLTGVSVYIYDSGIDLDDPAGILQGLEFLLPLSEAEKLQVEVPKIELETGDNVVSADTGDVTVTYAIDTKTYIDEQDEKLREQIGQLSADMADKVTSPSVATVGQVIAVKAVDENGKPTEWEAVDMSGGASSWNDLTDRPFGETHGDTLAWDGTLGVLDEAIGFYTKISDAVPTINDVKNGIIIDFGEAVELSGEEAQSFFTDDGLANMEFLVIVPQDNYATNVLDMDTVFPEKGMYVIVEIPNATITIPGYDGFVSVQKIEEKYIPDMGWCKNIKLYVTGDGSGVARLYKDAAKTEMVRSAELYSFAMNNVRILIHIQDGHSAPAVYYTAKTVFYYYHDASDVIKPSTAHTAEYVPPETTE